MFSSDFESERATSIEDYQNTCTNFIYDISIDYKDWVDRYKLTPDETDFRKTAIDSIVKTTNQFIVEFGDTIKKIDIIMNDGISKMAENTAGYPFSFQITNRNQLRYCIQDKGPIKLNIKATPRSQRLVRICNYDKDNMFLLSSSNDVELVYSDSIFESVDLLNEYLIVKPKTFEPINTISITIKAEEIEDGQVKDSRGYTFLTVIK